MNYINQVLLDTKENYICQSSCIEFSIERIPKAAQPFST